MRMPGQLGGLPPRLPRRHLHLPLQLDLLQLPHNRLHPMHKPIHMHDMRIGFHPQLSWRMHDVQRNRLLQLRGEQFLRSLSQQPYDNIVGNLRQLQ